MANSSDHIGYRLEDLIALVEEYVAENSLIHARSFLLLHYFEFAFEEIIDHLVINDTTIPRSLYESLNDIGISLGIDRNTWIALETKTNN